MARLGRSQPIRTHVPKAVVAPGGPVKIVGQSGTKITVVANRAAGRRSKRRGPPPHTRKPIVAPGGPVKIVGPRATKITVIANRDARTRRVRDFQADFTVAKGIVAPGRPVTIVGQRGTIVTRVAGRHAVVARRRVFLYPHLAQPVGSPAGATGTAAIFTLNDVAAASGNETFLSTAAVTTLNDVAAAAGNETFLSTAAIFTFDDIASGVATVPVDATVAVGSIAATATFPTLRLQALRTSGWTRLRIQTDVRLPDVKHRDRNENF